MIKTKTLILTLLLSIAAICLLGCAESASGGNSAATSTDKSVSYSAKQSVKGESDFDDQTAAADTYNVVFNLNYDGAEPTIEKVNAGATVAAPTAPTRDGDYSFGAWYVDKNCTTLYDFSSKVNKNLVLFAGWISGKVNVTFNFNYVGAPAVERVSLAKGGTVAEPVAPEREDYAFDGWFDGETKYDFTTELQTDLTLYAHWHLTKATVTFDFGFENAPEDKTVKVDVGAKVEAVTDIPQRDEYDFVCWTTDNGEAYDFNESVGADFTLKAKWTIKTFTVGFNWNGYAGTPESVTVEYGQTISEPTNTRQDFVCIWKNGSVDYDFSTPVTSSFTLVADWTAESTDNVTMTFYYNFTGAPDNGVYVAQTVKKNQRPTRPDTPERAKDGTTEYYFEGWYSDADCTTTYNFNTRISKNTAAYAKWFVKYTFEAEYTNLDGKEGRGYSSNTSGTQLIKKDNGTAQASNGYYVSDLYYNGSEILFEITSDKDVTDAVVIIRVSGEHYDMDFTPDVYEIAVNGTALDYDTFSLEGGEADIRSDDRRPFINVTMKVRASLKKGKNTITMTAIADHDFDVGGRHSGTMKAIAPMIDCIYVCTDATLTWSPKTSNTANI